MAKAIKSVKKNEPQQPTLDDNEQVTEAIPGTDLAPEVKEAKKPEAITTLSLIQDIFSGYGENATEAQRKSCNKTIQKYLQQSAATFECFENYNIVVLYDEGSLIKNDADRIYNSITKFTAGKPLLMVLYSRGGSIGSAYLIGKLCREYCNNNFIITIPRMAKSAATLVCCAANEIHMGSLSELGPIDPQINDLPVLGLKYSVEHIAELVKRYPASSEMFAKYLNLSLELINLGYYERVAESAMQYAEKLLLTHEANLPRSAKDIASELVYKYKDHGFVVDWAEAIGIFGEDIIKRNTAEYELGNTLYRSFEFIKNIAAAVNHDFYFIGSLDSEGVFTKRQKTNK